LGKSVKELLDALEADGWTVSPSPRSYPNGTRWLATRDGRPIPITGKLDHILSHWDEHSIAHAAGWI
jgi:hypothetical protein